MAPPRGKPPTCRAEPGRPAGRLQRLYPSAVRVYSVTAPLLFLPAAPEFLVVPVYHTSACRLGAAHGHVTASLPLLSFSLEILYRSVASAG